MEDKKGTNVMDARQTMAERIISNAFTFGMLILCAYVSQGSTWWTFCTGLFFITFIFFRMAAIFQERNNKFLSKAELVKWANSLDEW